MGVDQGFIARWARLLGALLALFTLVGGGLPAVAQAPSRVALVIANSKYQSVVSLRNPVPDSTLIEQALKKAGFTWIKVVRDANKATMEAAIKEFGVKADTSDVSLVYYAGHGVEFAGRNFLVPVDARLDHERDADSDAVPLDAVLRQLEGARRLRIVILDACRNNPFPSQSSSGTRSVGRGLARVEPQGDSLVVYSAKAGSTAQDGDGANSPFATALANRLAQPGLEISLLFRHVRDDVLTATNHDQEPFTYGSLSGQEFYFVPGAPGTASAAAAVDMEAETWALCRGAASRGPCDAYLTSYSSGKFRSLANARIADLNAKNAMPTAAAASVADDLAAQIGVAVRNDGNGGIIVDRVQASGIAEGQLLAGDIIKQIDSAAPPASGTPGKMLDGALAERGRLKLLVQRGPTTTVVILRSASL